MSTLDRLRIALADRYRVEKELGAGGMATVYLAHDLRHERDVAIKVLHPDLGAALGADRFLAEIKTTAKLQHPHILPLLDSGAADGLLYYVMPYVRGETLRARLERERQLPVPDALRIAREVAGALEHAHKQGIIHRDIKPENILLQDGSALVADFGIALAVQSAGTQRLTQTGLSLGTPQYMSPEQAMGDRSVDARSDQYSLAAVLYEMLVGTPPFAGINTQSIVARILTERPPSLTAVRDTVSGGLEGAVLRGLAKLPADRFGDVQAFAEACRDDAVSVTGSARASASPSAVRRLALWPTIVVALACTGAGAFLGQRVLRSDPTSGSRTQFTLDYLSSERVSETTYGYSFAFDEQRKALLYVGVDSALVPRVYRRPLDGLIPSPIKGTEGASNPVLSPDGAWIAFVREGNVEKMPAEGGASTVLAQYQSGTLRGLAWVNDSTLLFGRLNEPQLFAVSSGGGTPRAVFRVDAGQSLRWPVSVGDGDHVVFVDHTAGGANRTLFVGSLTKRTVTRIPADFVGVAGADGESVFLVNEAGDLSRQSVDWSTGAPRGSATRLVTGVANYPALSLAVAKVSTQGHIAFLQAVTDSRLVVSTPDGGVSPVSPDSGFVSGPRVSPDGRRIAYTLITGRSTMARVLDRASGTVTALAETRPGVAREVTGWSGDGRLVLFEYDSGGVAEIHSRPYDKSAPESWFPTPNGASPVEASPDGVHVLGRFTLTRDDVDRDVWWWTVRDTTRRRFTSGPALDQGARFSPDGRWVAWTANEDGPREAFVAPFPGPGARLQISQGGVSSIAWARDGRGVYLAQANRIARVDIELGANPRVTGRRDVLHADLLLGTETFGPFDVGPSGEIVATAPRRERKVVVVLTATKPGDREP